MGCRRDRPHGTRNRRGEGPEDVPEIQSFASVKEEDDGTFASRIIECIATKMTLLMHAPSADPCSRPGPSGSGYGYGSGSNVAVNGTLPSSPLPESSGLVGYANATTTQVGSSKAAGSMPPAGAAAVTSLQSPAVMEARSLQSTTEPEPGPGGVL